MGDYKLYAEDESYKLYQGKMQDVIDNFLEENSIDCIITDPPYGLTSITERFGKEGSAPAQEGTDGAFKRLSRGFMGQLWDGSGVEYDVETWKRCLKVLKPGGYLLAFGGSRTFHRIACAIEDAGFEIRDTIMWLYGCLSEDTEILTSNGWKNKNEININDEIYSLDLLKDELIKNKVKFVFEYDYDGKMINFKNQNTDQLLTPNHHCIIKDEFRVQNKCERKYINSNFWQYRDAWQMIGRTSTLPLSSKYNGNINFGCDLLCELLGLIIAEGTYHKKDGTISICQSSANQEYVKRIRYILGKLNIDYSEYSRVRKYKDILEKYGTIHLSEDKLDKEYTLYDFYIKASNKELLNKIFTICPDKKLTWGMLELSYKNKKALIKGLLEGDGSKKNGSLKDFSAFCQKEIDQLEIFQVLLHMTRDQGWINKRFCSIHHNPTTEIQYKHNKKEKSLINYKGKVWCIETEIGNFMARRNGKIFITGNSSMPKATDIGLMIDKRNGVKSKIIGYEQGTMPDFKDVGEKQKEMGNINKRSFGQVKNSERKEQPIYQAQNEWAGWKSSLKPMFEPIIMARKPFKGSLTDNVLENGVGALNIEECRIGEEVINVHNAPKGTFAGGERDRGSDTNSYREHSGRYPGNVIHDGSEEATQFMPNTKGSDTNELGSYGYTFGKERDSKPMAHGYNDEGSAARYFYTAKASSKDRDEGLDEFEKINIYKDGDASWGYANTQDDNFGDRIANVKRANIHPT